MNNFYSEDELTQLGLQSYGEKVFISRKCSIYRAERIKIGNNVRIDDFCILSGKIQIGSYVHISAFCGLFAGDAGIRVEDFVSISSRSALYAITDDYSGNALANPMVLEQYRNVISEKIILEKHSLIGTGCTILPGVVVKEGCSIGAMSLVKHSLEEWGIYAGIPCVRIKNRSQYILELEEKFNKDTIRE